MLKDLDLCHGFLPNHVEAMAYSRTDTPQAALEALSRRAPLVVVTQGVDGAIAIDSTTGERAMVPSLRVPAIDPTGAGDVFSAGIVLGTLAGWPLEQRLLFSTLCAALTVSHFGGSLASPGWGDISDWWASTKLRARDNAECQDIAKRYGFLDDVLPLHKLNAVRRAEATFGLLTEAEAHYRPHERFPTPPVR
jgi:bifunctional ADP-heptose synthase (sugar kinase/adenylyltransferase)